jgi:hypothetical protein
MGIKAVQERLSGHPKFCRVFSPINARNGFQTRRSLSSVPDAMRERMKDEGGRRKDEGGRMKDEG